MVFTLIIIVVEFLTEETVFLQSLFRYKNFIKLSNSGDIRIAATNVLTIYYQYQGLVV